MKLTLVSDTLFKQRAKPCRELSSDEICLMEKGSQFDEVLAETAAFNHVRLRFQTPIGSPARTFWYANADHIEVQGNMPDNHPHEKPAPDGDRPDRLKLPGYRSIFYLDDPVLTGGSFTWNDITHRGTRIPITRNIVVRALRMAETLQEIQALFGHRPIAVTSWYRTPSVNQRIGGSPYSLHLTGGAVDFNIAGVSAAEAYRRLDSWWGNQGGLAYSKSFVHIDNRGYRARWTYSS